jgi:hypothetical protein
MDRDSESPRSRGWRRIGEGERGDKGEVGLAVTGWPNLSVTQISRHIGMTADVQIRPSGDTPIVQVKVKFVPIILGPIWCNLRPASSFRKDDRRDAPRMVQNKFAVRT